MRSYRLRSLCALLVTLFAASRAQPTSVQTPAPPVPSSVTQAPPHAARPQAQSTPLPTPASAKPSTAGQSRSQSTAVWSAPDRLAVIAIVVALIGTIANLMMWLQMIKSTRQTQIALGISQRDLELSHRAWIVVGDLGDTSGPPVDVSQPGAYVEISFKNVGGVPARELRSRARTARLSEALSLEHFSTLPESDGPIVVGPGEERFIKLGIRQFMPEDTTAHIAGEWKLYLFGEITYSDDFCQNRLTRFAHVLDFSIGHWMDLGALAEMT